MYNERIYLTQQNYYNLTDVGYVYTISVKAFSLVISDDQNNQTMASIEKTIIDYKFDTFSSGNGSDENPYLIYTETELRLIKYNKFAIYKLMNDIEFKNNFITAFDKENPFVAKVYQFLIIS